MIASLAVALLVSLPPRLGALPAPPRSIAAATRPRATAAPGSDRWFGPDKVKHFFISAFIQSVTYSALRGARVAHGSAMAGASVAAAGFGLGKEVHDWRVRREFSVRDLAWDAAGAGAAAAALSHTLR